MKRRIRSRAVILGLLCVSMAVLAAAPRPARPAIPAKPAQQTMQGPLQGKTILVDAGHGGADGGARARDSRVWEKEINLQAAQALREALEDAGATVIMTRETDAALDPVKRADLTGRLSLARESNADLLISVHMNEYRTRRESGPQVFYRAQHEPSRLLAAAIQEAMIQRLRPSREREALAGDYFILSLDIPSVLTEWGFLSNAAEEKLLLTPEYRQEAAQAIRDGVITYFELTSEEE